MAKIKTRAWLAELARRAGESEELRKEFEQNVREQQFGDRLPSSRQSGPRDPGACRESYTTDARTH